MKGIENPKHVGSFAKSDGIVTGEAGSVHQGDMVIIQLQVNDKGIITDAKFKAFGSGPCIAVCSYATDFIINKTIAVAATLNAAELKRIFDLPDIRVHCAMLVEDAIKAAIDHYQTSREL